MGKAVGPIDDMVGSVGQLQSQLGVSEEKARGLAKTARGVFADNFGSSAGQAVEVVGRLHQQLGLTGDQAGNAAKDVFRITDAFGEQGASADGLIENLRTMKAAFPGQSEGQLMDMVAQSFQKGTGSAGDLTDTIQEYPQHFDRLGLSAGDMFNILDSGMANGARNTDFLGEAVKEFGVRIGETGSDAQKAVSKMFPEEQASSIMKGFEQGGAAARESFFEVAEGLRGIEDPSQRAAAAQELFGTKGEDLIGVIDKMDWSKLKNGPQEATDATSKLDAQYQNFGALLSTATRHAQMFAAEGLMAIMPHLRTVASWLRERIPAAVSMLQSAWQSISGVLTPVVEQVAAVIRERLMPPLQRVVTFFQTNQSAMQAFALFAGTVLVAAFTAWAVSAGLAAAATIAANAPIIALIAVIGGLAAGVFLLIKHWDAIVAKFPILGTIVEQVKAIFVAFGAWITGTLVPILMGIADAVMQAGQKAIGFVQKHWGTIQTVISGALTAIQGVVEGAWTIIQGIIEGGLKVIKGVVNTVMGVLTGDWERAWEGVKQIVDGVWTIIEGYIDGYMKAIKGIIKGALEATEAIWRPAWEAIKNFVDTVWGKIETIINTVTGGIETTIDTFLGTIEGWWETSWGAIKTTVDTITGGIETIVSNTVGAIESTWNGIKTFLTSTVPGWFTSLKTGAGNALGGLSGVIAAPLNAALGSLESFGNAIGSGINWIAGKLGAGSPIPTFSVPRVPSFEKGGVAPGGMALVGERGPELVQLNQGDRVLPNDQTMKMLQGMGVPGFFGGGIVDKIGDGIGEIGGFLGGLAERFGKWVTDIPGIDKLSDALAETVASLGKHIVDGLMSIPGVGDIANLIGNGVSWLVNKAMDVMGVVTPDLFAGLGRGLFDMLKGYAVDWAKSIWPFANGGIAMGPTLGMLGEREPEAVVPLSKMRDMGGGGVTVEVNMPNATINAQDRRQAERAAGTFAWGTVSALRSRGVA